MNFIFRILLNIRNCLEGFGVYVLIKNLEHKKLNNIDVYGSQESIERIESAILLLENKYPYGYTLLKNNIKRIVADKWSKSSLLALSSTVFEKIDSDDGNAIPIELLAGHLVRRSVQCRVIKKLRIFRVSRLRKKENLCFHVPAYVYQLKACRGVGLSLSHLSPMENKLRETLRDTGKPER